MIIANILILCAMLSFISLSVSSRCWRSFTPTCVTDGIL